MKHPEPVQISQTDSRYPAGLRTCLGHEAPAVISIMGSPDILERKMLALFCSVKCPGKLILETYDLAQRLRQAGVPVISGFHSPMERECLVSLLRGTQPVVICLARSLAGARVNAVYGQPLAQGRLLLVSPFQEKEHRTTTQTALYRNRVIAAMADKIFVAHAAPSSKTEHFCHEVMGWGKPVYTLESDANANLLAMGAVLISPYSGGAIATPMDG